MPILNLVTLLLDNNTVISMCKKPYPRDDLKQKKCSDAEMD
jgi:hypothetical protein